MYVRIRKEIVDVSFSDSITRKNIARVGATGRDFLYKNTHILFVHNGRHFFSCFFILNKLVKWFFTFISIFIAVFIVSNEMNKSKLKYFVHFLRMFLNNAERFFLGLFNIGNFSRSKMCNFGVFFFDVLEADLHAMDQRLREN